MIDVAGLASIASLWVAIQGTVFTGETTRALARSAAPRPDPMASRPIADFDVELTPMVALTLSSGEAGRTSLTVGYAPNFTRRSLFRPEETTLILHNAFASIAVGGADWRVNLAQSFSLGTQSFSRLTTSPVNPNAPPTPTAPRIDLIPTVETVKIFSESTSLGLSYDWTRRWTSSMAASYGISGGWGATSRMTLPRQKIMTGTLTLDYLFTRRDRFGGMANAANVKISGGPMEIAALTGDDYWSFTAGATWHHQFSTTSSGQLMVGTVALRSVPVYGDRYVPLLTVAASGNLELIKFRKFITVLTMGAALVPAVNALNGIMQQRAQGTGSLVTTIDRLSISVNGDVAQSIPPGHKYAYRIVGAGASVTYRPALWIDVGADYRSAWQSANDPRVASLPRLWSASIFATLRGPPLRF